MYLMFTPFMTKVDRVTKLLEEYDVVFNGELGSLQKITRKLRENYAEILNPM